VRPDLPHAPSALADAAGAAPTAAPTAPPASGVVAGLRRAIVEHRLLIGVLAALIASGFAAQAALGLPNVMRNLRYPPSYYYFTQLLLFPLPFAFLWIRLRACDADGRWLQGRAGWSEAWRRFRRLYLNPARIAGALVAGLCIAAAINVFGAWKLSIPRVHPFTWDARLAALDRALAFGRYPWERLQPILGHPAITNALDITYYTWLPLVAIVCAWQAWSPRSELRLRFFLTFVLTWILLGDVAATLLSSAGPCFYRYVVSGPDPFAPLFAYHARVAELYHLGTPIVQAALWQDYVGHTADPYTGISAMPSIHVSMPVLYTLVGWRTWRPLGVLFGIFGLAIWLGSIHLGWHYAVDGYASIVGVLAIWWATGAAIRRFAPDLAR
jgi:hypothetical protein